MSDMYFILTVHLKSDWPRLRSPEAKYDWAPERVVQLQTKIRMQIIVHIIEDGPRRSGNDLFLNRAAASVLMLSTVQLLPGILLPLIDII